MTPIPRQLWRSSSAGSPTDPATHSVAVPPLDSSRFPVRRSLHCSALTPRARPPPKPLNVLILEDQADAAAMMKRELHKDDLAINLRRVDTRQGFTKALDTFQPDIVLVGSTLPGFDGSEALLYMRSNHPEIPAVIITEAPGEEAAIELLKAGAKDYGRLGPSVERALAIELGIRARKSAEKALRAANTPQQATEWIAHVGGFDGVSVSAIATIGIAQYSPEVPAPAELLKLADQALYQAKQQGRDRYCFHSPETDGVLRLNPSPA